MFDIEFWRNFLSNALATFVGVIIGIPIALWINRIQQKSLHLIETQKSIAESKSRKTKILQLLLGELNENLILLNSINDDLNGRSDDYQFDNYKLKTELWGAFSDGGELQWIHDLDLLNALALAYDVTRMAIFSGERYETHIEISMTGSNVDSSVSRDRAATHHHYLLLESVRKDIEVAKSSIANAIIVIDEYLKS